MASRQARQDRLLERQRGAGRQVRGGGLQLVLPGQTTDELQPRRSGRSSKTPQQNPLRPQRSSRRTPAGELAPQRSSKRTPGPLLTSQQSSRRTPAEPVSSVKRSRGRPPTSSSKKRSLAAADGLDAEDSVRPGKRSKLAQTRSTVDEQVPSIRGTSLPTQDVTNTESPNQGSSKKRKKRKSIGQQSNRRPKVNAALHQDATRDALGSRKGRPRLSYRVSAGGEDAGDSSPPRRGDAGVEPHRGSDEDAVVLPTIEPTRGTGFTPHKKRKKRVSIGQQSRRKPKADLVAVKEEPEASEIDVAALPQHDEMFVGGDDSGDDRQLEDDADDELAGASETVKGRPKTKRKKRKSIGQQSLKRITNVARRTTKAAVPKSTILNDRTDQPGHSNTAPIAQSDAAGSRSRIAQPGKRGRKPSQMLQKNATNDGGSRKSGMASQKKSQGQSDDASLRPPPTGTVPITVYRPPTPDSAASSDGEAARSAQTSRTKSTGFNAVDVLAQITLERLSKHAARLNSKPDTTHIQRKAFELYTTEVEARLRQVSRALDRSKVLDTKLKASTKEEKELKSEMKELVAERATLEEQKDELETRKRRLELESLLGRIESVTRKAWQIQ